MENTPDQTKEEVNVDFGEENPQNDIETTIADLDSMVENVDAEQSENMKMIKEMVAKNTEKIEAAIQMPTDVEGIDEKSIFVKQVDYTVTPEELLNYFSSCGTITRLRILSTKNGVHKGAAYIEFADPESVKSAMMFNGQTFHDRQLVVEPKRKTLPRYALRGRGRGRGGHRGGYRPY